MVVDGVQVSVGLWGKKRFLFLFLLSVSSHHNFLVVWENSYESAGEIFLARNLTFCKYLEFPFQIRPDRKTTTDYGRSVTLRPMFSSFVSQLQGKIERWGGESQ